MDDLYEILGIPPNSSQEEIKKAFHELSKKYHPDKFTDEVEKEEAEKKFQEISLAYAILKNKDKRAKYDSTGNVEQNAEDAQVIGFIVSLFENIIAQDVDYKHHDLISVVHEHIKEDATDAAKQIQEYEEEKERCINIRDRIHYDGEVNVLRESMGVKITSCEEAIKQQVGRDEVCTKALELLKKYTYSIDGHPISLIVESNTNE